MLCCICKCSFRSMTSFSLFSNCSYKARLASVWAFRQLEEFYLRERPDSYYSNWKWDSRMWCQYQNLTPGFEATKPLWRLRPCRHLQPQTYLRWNILALQLFNGCCSGGGSEYLPTKVVVPGSMTSIDFFEFQFPQHSPWTTRFSICIYIKYTLLRPYISFFSSSSVCKLHKFNN